MKTTALITGASSGIGKEFARIHAQRGGDLVLVARREDRLKDLKAELENNYKIKVLVIAKDLSILNAPEEIYRQVKSEGIQIDYLINNAGFGGHGLFHERPLKDDLSMIQVNILALTMLTKLFLPDMVKRNTGKVLNVSSTASFLPGPLQAVYYASKAYVTSLGEAISEELSGTNVTVTTLCPGGIETEFAKRGNLEDVDIFKNGKLASPASVASFGYDSMLQGKGVVINGGGLRLMKKVIPLIPRGLLLKMSRKTMEKTN